MIKKISLYYHTLRHMKVVQILGRIFFHLKRPCIKNNQLGRILIQAPSTKMVTFALGAVKMISPGHFTFLNRSGSLEKSSDWNDPQKSQLWLYNLHYFDDLQAELFLERKSWHEELIKHWIVSNPQGSGNGWLPYPLSLRIVNWIKWHFSGGELSSQALTSLKLQLLYLGKRIEYHLQGNHLFVNGKALFIGGLFFDHEWSWKTGLKIITQGIAEQIRGDGSNFEQSPMYHAIFLEDVLDLINFSRAYGMDVPKDWEIKASKMLDFLRAVLHPDGSLAHFNDTAQNFAKSPAKLIEYAYRMKIYPQLSKLDELVFKDAGLVRLERDKLLLLIDGGVVGPRYVFSHVHADSLSFELSYLGKRVFVNAGISEYGHGPLRLKQRSTSSHNTLEVDGENSSEVWQGFRTARRAVPIVFKYGFRPDFFFEGAHDGYTRLVGAPLHRRKFLYQDKVLEIQDFVEGKGEHEGRVFLHLAPGILPKREKDGTISLSHYELGKMVELRFQFEGEASIIPSHYWPEFGNEEANFKLILIQSGPLPLTFKTFIRFL